mmetsp:Transcript_2350/g.8403  ORF Transcript_2350/g.8403 Transcript_2350/m.8403 type:complete len:506 (+) Transcript_2350:97-1614(+)
MTSLRLAKLWFAIGAACLSCVPRSWGSQDVAGARAPSAVLDYLEEHLEQHKQEIVDIVSIPSISALPEHLPDVEKCADWIVARTTKAGLENAKKLPTGAHPVVYADWLHAKKGAATVLIYAHYDVQPVDPLDLWNYPPFEPKWTKEDTLLGRGASDDKGSGLMGPIWAVEAVLRTMGTLPVNVKFLFEGQEEIMSPNMPEFLAQHKATFACDYIFISDGSQPGPDLGGVPLGLRGIVGLEVSVRTAAGDLHSGTWGGSIRNAAHVIADLASSLHHENGTIAVQGYYDQVRSLKPEERTVIDSYEFDEDAEAKSESVTLFGEAGASTLERRWVRPTIDVVGMWTGFQGNGIKTAIPSRASLKITSRLVPFQNAHECFSLIEAHVKKHVPEGVSFEIHSLANGNDPALMPRNSVSQMAASYVLKALYGKDPVFLYYGGSIPIVSLLSKMLKREPTILAFGLDGLNIHAPNEFYPLKQLVESRIAYAHLLFEVAAQHGASAEHDATEL